MPRVSPFTGLLYDTHRVGPLSAVTSPPYDMVSAEAKRRNLEGSPFHVSRLELGREGAIDDDYRSAADTLARWRRDGVLVPTEEPRCYAYSMSFRLGGRARTVRGIIAAVALEEWGGSIIPHERVLPGPVDDRLLLLRATRANASCIEIVVPGPLEPLARMWTGLEGRAPDAQATDEEGVEHHLWVVPMPPGLEDALGSATALIADGHHRYTTALRYREERRTIDGDGPWDAAMMLVIDGASEQPPVLPYHRTVPSAVLPEGARLVRDLAEILEGVDDETMTCGVVVRTAGGIAHALVTFAGTPPVVRALDEVIDASSAATRFVHDAVEAEELVRLGDAGAAWILPATSVERIRAVVDAGHRLPEKSTYFWPKPRTGLVIRPLDPPPTSDRDAGSPTPRSR